GRCRRDGARWQRTDQPRSMGRDSSWRSLVARPSRPAGGPRKSDFRAPQADGRHPAQRPAAVGQLSCGKCAGVARRLVPRPGDEVVQLYIHDDEASVTRPVIELKRFQRVTLRPGERRTITFELTPDDLALWNPDMKKVVEPGTFTIFAGPNSVDLKSAKLTVT